MTTAPDFDPNATSFDRIYAATRGGDPRQVPWAHGAPHPLFQAWLDGSESPQTDRSRALVIGSGLGDDAEALAARGWSVTGFDVSAQAIDWARERFPGSAVAYQVRDLFALPDAWSGAFDLVVEIHTVQSLPVTLRQAAIRAIAVTVAPAGTLVVVAMTRDARVPLRGRPWLLTETEVGSFTRYGLVETDRLVGDEPTAEHPGRVRCVFTRPAGIA